MLPSKKGEGFFFYYYWFICCWLTISGHDAQGHEGIASHQLVVVCDELTKRIQSPKAQQGNLILISWQQRESVNRKIKYDANAGLNVIKYNTKREIVGDK